MKTEATRPDACEDKHLTALDRIRESGLVNMWGGSEPLRQVFPDLTVKQSAEILLYWMETFTERHPNTEGTNR